VVKLDAVDSHHKGMWLEEKESESDSSGRTQFPSTRLESSDDLSYRRVSDIGTRRVACSTECVACFFRLRDMGMLRSMRNLSFNKPKVDGSQILAHVPIDCEVTDTFSTGGDVRTRKTS
jgi:hypothetical protein